MENDKIYSLCEAVADIARIAAKHNYYSGDQRGDIANFIEWAYEFEKVYEGVEWGVNSEKEYIDTINEFVTQKINPNVVNTKELAFTHLDNQGPFKFLELLLKFFYLGFLLGKTKR